MDKTLYIGLGGAGMNIIKMAKSDLINPQFILLINSDKASLDENNDYESLLVGERILNGKASGGIKLGKKAIDELLPKLLNILYHNGYNKIVIISGASGGTGGNSPYLAQRLLKHKFRVGLAITDIFEWESRKEISQNTINQAQKISSRLMFFKLFKPAELHDTLSVDKKDNFGNYLDKLNQFIIDKVSQL